MKDGLQVKMLGMAAAAVLAFFPAVLGCVAARAATPPGEELFKKNNCVTCHAIDHKVVGPSYDDVAKKFAGQPDAAQTLSDAIKKGHVGTWGVVPMPPHPDMPDAQIQQIVAWILSLK
jgi:cytochrome c